jgi:predicted pyridoxine 5'-phosphate oxidase superfamily flavin-nucleotide-binding protein
MSIGVIPDLVTFSDDTTDNVRITINTITDDVKSCFDVPVTKYVEQPRSILRVRTIIKGHRDVGLRTWATAMGDGSSPEAGG